MQRWHGSHTFDQIRQADSKVTYFGNSKDIGITWDGTRLAVTQLTADSEIRWGVDGAGMDQRWYGDTSLAVMLWDQSADQLQFAGNASLNYQVGSAPTNHTPISVGRFVASAATGGGYVVTLTNSAGARFYAEDGAADLTSAATVRAAMARFLISGNYTQQAEVFGFQGQVVVKQATVNHNTAGIQGSWEAQTTAVTITGTSKDNIHAGLLGRVGVSVTATTVSATGVLAGISAMSNITDGYVTITTGGILAGLHVGRWASKQKWQYGLFVDEDSVDFCPIAVGTFVASAASGGGFAVTSTNSAAMRVYAEETADLGASAMVRSILGRFLVTGAITSNAECFGVVGQLVSKAATIAHDNAGVLGTFEAQTTAVTISGTGGDHVVAAVMGRVGVTVTATTVNATGILAGVAAMSNITDGYVTVTSGGILAGVYVGEFSSKQNWNYGVYLASCNVGISADNVTLTPDANRTYMALSVGTRATEKSITMAGAASQHLDPIQMNLNFIGTIPTSTSTVNGFYMQLTHDTTAMTGYLRLKGCDWTITIGQNLQDAYVFQGEVDFTAATTVGGEVAGIGITMSTAATSVVTGNVWGAILVTSFTSAVSVGAGLFLSHRVGTLTHSLYIECNSGATITDAIYINAAGTLTNPLNFSAVIANAVSVTTEAPLNDISATANQGYIRVLVGATVRYIPLYAAKS